MTSPYLRQSPLRLPAAAPWPAAIHRFDAKTVAALEAAEATGRPLLIRGLPGVGKSMTARAAAFARNRPLQMRVIDSRMEADDLKARFDTVRRLADAQVRREPGEKLPSPTHYLRPDVLWWGFNWASAERQHELYLQQLRAGAASADIGPGDADLDPPPPRPEDPETHRHWNPAEDRAVVLLDEIDKADPELPNALLEALGSNAFTVPVTGQLVACEPRLRPLILITTNEERELSPAFLRRCLVLWLELPKTEPELVNHLVQIAGEHQAYLLEQKLRRRPCADKALLAAAKALAHAHISAHAAGAGAYVPGTAEYLDLVAALADLAEGEDAQCRAVDELQDFVLKKSAGLGG